MNNSIQKNYDVIIVGAGPCGVAAAHMLNQHKVKTLIVDKEKDILTIPRAVGMCEEGSRILNSIGLLDDMKHEFRLINRVNFQNKKNKAVFHADTYDEINGHRMLRTFHQPDLERSARSALINCQYVHLITETELLDFSDNGNHISATLSKNGDKTII